MVSMGGASYGTPTLNHVAIKASAAVSTNTNGTAFDVSSYGNLIIFVNCSAVSGSATPGVTIKLQDGGDNAAAYVDCDSVVFPIITAVGVSTPIVLQGAFSKNLRLVYTVSGTSP